MLAVAQGHRPPELLFCQQCFYTEAWDELFVSNYYKKKNEAERISYEGKILTVQVLTPLFVCAHSLRVS